MSAPRHIICVALAVAALMLGAPAAHARWATIDDAETVLESSHEKIHIHADGSWEIQSTRELSIMKEKGIDQLKLVRIPYDPNIASYSVVSAKAINGSAEAVVSPFQIEDKALASTEEGIGRRNQITIPFRGLQVGSRIKFQLTAKHKPGFVPGHFHMTNVFGMGQYTRKDDMELTSEVPVYVRKTGTDNLVSVTESKEGALFKLRVSLIKPIWRELINEPNARLGEGMVPKVEISTQQDWQKIAAVSAAKMEQAFAEPLPPEMQAIADAAAKKPSEREKIEHVMAELISKVKYLGDWRSEKNYNFPRSLAEIWSSKQGDCKDFSLSTAAMLRKLGMPAKVAWVMRGTKEQRVGATRRPMLPDLHHFNHAIVYLEHGGKKYWLDPTNPVAHAGDPFPDISDRHAFVVDATRTDMDYIPAVSSKANRLEAHAHYSFVGEVLPDAMARVKASGPAAAMLAAASESMGSKAPPGALTLSVVDPDREVIALSVVGKEKKSKAVGGEFSETITYTPGDSSQATSMGYAFAVPSPRGLSQFLVTAEDRVSDLDLGDPGTFDVTFVFAGMSVKGDVPKGCQVASRWGRASRSYDVVSGGVVLSDKAETLARVVTAEEMRSPEYRSFQAQISRCFAKSTLFYTYEPVFRPYIPGDASGGRQRASAKVLNSLIEDKAAMFQQAEEILGAQGSKGNFTLAKLVFADRVLASPEDPRGYAWLAWAILGSVPADGSFTDPVTFEAARTIVRTARNERMTGAELDTVESVIWLFMRKPGKSEELLHKALKANPSLTPANALLIAMHTARGEPRGRNHDDFVVSTTQGQWSFEEVLRISDRALADPKQAHARGFYRQQKVHALLHLGRVDAAEAVHEEILKDSPESVAALMNFSNFMTRVNKPERALELATRALALRKDSREVRALYARALYPSIEKKMIANPDDSEGATQLEEILRSEEGGWRAHFFLANYYRRRAVLTRDPQLVELEKKHRDSYLTQANAEPGKPFTGERRDRFGDLVHDELKTTPTPFKEKVPEVSLADLKAEPEPGASLPVAANPEPMGPPLPTASPEVSSPDRAPASAGAPIGAVPK